MTGIFPDTAKGGVVVRTVGGAPTSPPNVVNAYVPAAPFVMDGAETALPSSCAARFSPEQMNAFASEILALAEAMNPTGTWALGSVNNLAANFAAFTAASSLATTGMINAAITALIASSPVALDTLNELAVALGNDPNFATTMATALGNRLRFDAAQSLSTAQRAQAYANMRVAEMAALGGVGNFRINAAVASGALTLSLKTLAGNNPSAADPIIINARDSTASSGAYTPVVVTSAISITIPSGNFIGTANNVPFRIWLCAITDGATVELAVINCVGGGATPTGVFAISDDDLATSTNIGIVTTAQTLLSTTPRTGWSRRILGYVEYSAGLATAGTWASVPTKIQALGPGVSLPGRVVQSRFAKTNTPGPAVNSTTLVDTGLSCTIAPKSAANLVMVRFNQADTYCDNVATYGRLASLRGSTVLLDHAMGLDWANATNIQQMSGAVLDAPGVTSATTYKTQISRVTGAGSLYAQNTGGYSTMTLEEIMA